MLGFEVTPTASGKVLQIFLEKYPKAVEAAVKETAIYGKKLIVKSTPRRTGDARKSWEVTRRDSRTYVIESITGRGAAYTPYLEHGTGVHGPRGDVIRPKRAKYLRFPIIKGNTIRGWVTTAFTMGMTARAMIRSNLNDIRIALLHNMEKQIYKLHDKLVER